jgi:hypothetical protein
VARLSLDGPLKTLQKIVSGKLVLGIGYIPHTRICNGNKRKGLQVGAVESQYICICSINRPATIAAPGNIGIILAAAPEIILPSLDLRRVLNLDFIKRTGWML